MDSRVPGVSRLQFWAYRSIIGLAIATLCLVLVVGYWLLRPYNPLELTGPIRITNKPIPAGSLAYYTVDQCRNTDKVARAIRRLVTDTELGMTSEGGQVDRTVYVPLGSSDSHAPVGCYTFSPPPTIIPIDTVPGRYHIEYEIHFQMNPVRDVVVYLNSETFEVVKPLTQ